MTSPGIGASTLEYATDTSRTITHILFSGTATKFPDIRWIFSHSGGTLPFLTARLELVAKAKKMPDGVMPVLRKFYYELAQASHRGAIAGLTAIVPKTQLLFGTDFPFRSAVEHLRLLGECGLSEAEIDEIARINPARLLAPR